MDYKKFKSISIVLNSILKKHYLQKEVISISWLYLKRLHPHYLSQYKIISYNSLKLYTYLLFEFLIYNFRILIKLVKTVIKRKKKINLKKQKIIIFSHFIHSHNYKTGDFYYQFLDNDLRKKKFINQIFLINDQKYINNSTLHDKYILLNENVKFSELFLIYFNQLSFSIKFFISFLNENNPLIKKINLILSVKCLQPSTIFNLIKFEDFSKIISFCRPKIVICNFEGNAIERLIFMASSQVNKNIKKVGYSHTTDFPFRNSVYIGFNSFLMPSQILVNSSHVKNEFENNGFSNLLNIGLLTNKSVNNFHNIKKENIILLIPEGIVEELNKFYDFALKLSNILSEFKFILRPHPVLKSKFKSNKNLFISSNSLSDDLKTSKFVLFRGSTLIIECINSGLIPIYLNFGENYQFHIFGQKFKNSMNEINYQNYKEFKFNQTKLNSDIFKYSMNYFNKYNFKKFENILKVK